jgi:hypothetical protein
MCRPQAQRASLNVYRDRSDRWLASALQDFFLKAIPEPISLDIQIVSGLEI